jgi:hypothetical protein
MLPARQEPIPKHPHSHPVILEELKDSNGNRQAKKLKPET